MSVSRSKQYTRPIVAFLAILTAIFAIGTTSASASTERQHSVSTNNLSVMGEYLVDQASLIEGLNASQASTVPSVEVSCQLTFEPTVARNDLGSYFVTAPAGKTVYADKYVNGTRNATVTVPAGTTVRIGFSTPDGEYKPNELVTRTSPTAKVSETVVGTYLCSDGFN